MNRSVPPAALALLAAVTQAAIAPPARPGRGSRLLSITIAAPSLLLLVGSVRDFGRAGTTVDPRPGATSSALVTGGPNAISRNPMYLGMAGLLVAHAAARRSVAAAFPVLAFVAWMDRVQIPREEAHLAERFPEEFGAYRTVARRWVGRRGAR